MPLKFALKICRSNGKTRMKSLCRKRPTLISGGQSKLIKNTSGFWKSIKRKCWSQRSTMLRSSMYECLWPLSARRPAASAKCIITKCWKPTGISMPSLRSSTSPNLRPLLLKSVRELLTSRPKLPQNFKRPLTMILRPILVPIWIFVSHNKTPCHWLTTLLKHISMRFRKTSSKNFSSDQKK